MDGTLEQLPDGRWQLQFKRTLPHSPEKVWRALTESEHLDAWFPTTIEGGRAPGAALRFAHRNAPGLEAFEGEMIAYEPPSAIEFRWGTDVIRMEVSPGAGGTVLTLLDTFEEGGKAARDGAGWHVSLDALAGYLDGEPNPRKTMKAWREVHPRYVERFGPEAATIGPPAGVG